MHVQWRPQRCPRAYFCGCVNSKLSFYFKISRTPCASCWCLPFNLEKMAAVSVTMFEENKELWWGHLLWVSDVDMSLLSMLQCLLLTSEMSEFVAGSLHLLSTAASSDGICLDLAPDDKVSLNVEFGRHHIFFILCSPSHSEHADPTASSSQPAYTINNGLLEAEPEM